VCEQDGNVAGYAYASQHRERAAYRWVVEVAAYVAEAQRGRGIGRALYTALTSLLARQGYHRALGLIALPNAASVALHESVGFKLATVFRDIGYKSGAWRDVGWWELALRNCDGKPGEPVSVQQLLNSEDWRTAIAAGEALLKV
jgi:phosphinothricin acetyltransferase